MPEFLFSVDRVRAQQIGLTQREVASNLLISLSSSGRPRPILAQPAERRELQRGRPHALVQDQFAGRAHEHTGHGTGTQRPQLFGNLATASRQTTSPW